jgi:hypothetical protein
MRYLLIILLITGCAKSVPLPPVNGKQAFFLECRGAALSWANCYEKANNICSAGYDLISKEQGRESQANGAMNNNAGGFTSGTGLDRSMTITCR